MAAERIKRLKDLVDRLERLPASEDRDRVLRQVRSRAVDIDTGETPSAMLPVREPIAPRVMTAPAPKRDRPARTTWPAAPPPPRAVEVAASEPREEWVSLDERLSLEDAPAPEGVQAVPPWTLGLRG
jgi:hypothetical protein